MSDLSWAFVLVCVASLPLALSMWALLDAARRPGWAFALAGRSQAVWVALTAAGVMVMIAGIGISAYYLSRVRPVVADAESGRLHP